MTNWRQTLIRVGIGTAISVNLMLLTMIAVSKWIPIESAIPSFASTSKPNLYTEYVMELKDRKQEGDYEVEHYQEMEITYDKQGQIVSKKPTTNDTYVRYWIGDNVEKKENIDKN